MIFQPEIRKALEQIGRSKLTKNYLVKMFQGGLMSDEHRDRINKSINDVADSAILFSHTRTGALFVFERETKLTDIASTGTTLNCDTSTAIFGNLFFNKAPLHDGAVIIRNNRIAAACCELPLTSNEEVVRGVGSRHRAAVGITEVSDCVVVVVSEQRHVISIANNGYLKKNYNQKADEFNNEASAKAIQKALRKDLTRLLRGDAKIFSPADDEADEVERRSIFPEIKLTWSFSDKSEKAEKHKPAVSREIGTSSSKGRKNRYHITQVTKAAKNAESTSEPSKDDPEKDGFTDGMI